jgi:hypothetical protein
VEARKREKGKEGRKFVQFYGPSCRSNSHLGTSHSVLELSFVDYVFKYQAYNVPTHVHIVNVQAAYLF